MSQIEINIESSLKDSVDRLWQSIQTTAEYIVEIKSGNKHLNEGLVRLSLIEQENILLKEERETLYKNNESLQSQANQIPNLLSKIDEVTKLNSEFEASIEKNQLEFEEKINELNSQLQAKLSLEENIGFAQKEITRRNFDLHQREDTINKLKEEIATLDSKIYKQKELENQIIDLNKIIENQNETLNQIKIEKDLLNKNIEENKLYFKNQAAEYEDQIRKSKNEIEQQTLALKSYSQRVIENNKEKAQYEEIIRNINGKLDYAEMELNNTQFQKDNQDELLNEIEVYKELITSNEKLIEENSFKLAQNQLVLASKDTNINLLNQKIEELESKIENLKNENDNLKNNIDTHSSNIQNLSEYEELKNQAKEFHSIIEKLQVENKQIDNLNFKIINLENEINIKNIQIHKINNRLAEALSEKELAEMDKELSKNITENNLDEKDLFERLNFTLMKAEAEINEKNSEIHKLNNRLAEVLSEKELIEMDIELNKSKTINLLENRDESDNLTFKIINLEGEVNEKNSEIHKLNNQIGETLAKYELLKMDYELLKSTPSSQLSLIENEEPSNYKLEELQNLLNSKDKKVEELSNKKNELESLIKTRYEQINLLEDQINGLSDKYNEDKNKKLQLAARIEDYLVKIEHILQN